MNWEIEQSTAILFGMACAILALVFLVAYLADQVIRQNAALAEDDYADHAACTAHIADVVSNRFVAVALRDMADRYDSITEANTLRRIRAGYDPSNNDEKSVPALWMLQYADKLDPPRDRDEEPMYNMDGKRVL